MRVVRFIFCCFVLISSTQFVSATTFVFKNGKRIDGTILYEDVTTIRIKDSTGMPMSLNRANLDRAAVQVANPPAADPPATMASVDVATVNAPLVQQRVFKNRDVRRATARTMTPAEYRVRLAKARQNYAHLRERCRTAGAVPSGKGTLRTDEYKVNGKRVRVTGYWANDEDVRRAKNVCAEAQQAQDALVQAEQDIQSCGCGAAGK